MSSLNVVGLTLLDLVLIFVVLRVKRRVVWLVLLFLVAPAALAIARWASVLGHWDETTLAIGIALAVTAVWWLAIGRRLPRPNSDVIKVWGQEKPAKPKPEEARTLQTENEQLRERNEQLEAELRQLKTGHNGDRPTTSKN